MNLREYFSVITGSARSDWGVISCCGEGSGPSYHQQLLIGSEGLQVREHPIVANYRPNIAISMAHGMECQDDLEEPWLEKFADQYASSHFLDFFYMGNLVHREVYVSVDGGRAHLPLPQIMRNEKREVSMLMITYEQDQFFQLLNQLEVPLDYMKYRNEAGFEVLNGSWPVLL